jgi:hypothetical protein
VWTIRRDAGAGPLAVPLRAGHLGAVTGAAGRTAVRASRPNPDHSPERYAMPYIDQQARDRIDGGGAPESAGELNYAVTRLVDGYIARGGGVRYALINEAVGALECAKLELYRRVAAPYEDAKIAQAGDVYRAVPPQP